MFFDEIAEAEYISYISNGPNQQKAGDKKIEAKN
jgi:hypothetical protein